MPRSRRRAGPSRKAKARGRELGVYRSLWTKRREEDPDYETKHRVRVHENGDEDESQAESTSHAKYEALVGSVDPALTSVWVEDGSFPFLDPGTAENSMPENYDMTFSSTYESPEDPLLNLEGTETVKIEGGASWNLQSDNFWACDTCNAEFQDYESLVQHISGNMCSEIELDNSAGVEFMEQSCDPDILYENQDSSYQNVSEQYPDLNLKQPILRLPRLDTYVCSTCSKIFLDKTIYLEHITTVHVESMLTSNSDLHPQPNKQRKFKCSYCPRLYNKKVTRRIHERVCPSANHEINFECWVCGAGFLTIEVMKKHIRNHFKCNLCPAKFLQQSHLVKHTSTHVGPNPFPCHAVSCGKRFTTSASLYTHHSEDHPDEPFYWVSSEERQANRETEIPAVESTKTTVRTYTTDTPNTNGDSYMQKNWQQAIQKVSKFSSGPIYSGGHTCRRCPATFANKGDVEKHGLNAQTDRFKCDLCDSRFCSNYSLRRHGVVVHDKISGDDEILNGHNTEESESGIFLMDDPQMVGDAAAINRMNTQSRKKLRWACDFCACTFSKKYSKQRHELAAHGEKNGTEDELGEVLNNDNETEVPVGGHHTINGDDDGNGSFVPGDDDSMSLEDEDEASRDSSNLSRGEELKCRICQRSFCSTFNRRRHESVVHGGKNGGEYDFGQALNNGTEDALGGNDPNNGDDEIQGFVPGNGDGSRTLEDETSRHSSSPLQDQELKCRVCKTLFYSKYSRQRHESGVHGILQNNADGLSIDTSIQQCRVCSKKFSTYTKLRTHMYIHTPGGRNRKWKCLSCDASFKLKYKLGQHYITNPLHKQIDCQDCWYPFASREEFDTHRRTNACITEKPPLILLD